MTRKEIQEEEERGRLDFSTSTPRKTRTQQWKTCYFFQFMFFLNKKFKPSIMSKYF